MNIETTLDTPEKKSSPARRIDNGRVLATENEEAVLHALSRYGFLSAVQLQALVWPTSTQPRLAQRTLRRLIEEHQVERQFVKKTGGQVYALTAAGSCRTLAVFAKDPGPTLRALDKAVNVFKHRQFGNDMCIWWETLEGNTFEDVNTEYEIEKGRALINKKDAHFGKTKGKVPDALLLYPGQVDPKTGEEFTAVGWGEVEMSKKKGKDYTHLISELCHLLGGYGSQRYTLPNGARVLFAMIACPAVEHEEKLVQGVLTHLATSPWKRYNWEFVKKGVCIWSGGKGWVNLNKWVLQHPEVAAWDEALRKANIENFGKT